MLVHSQPIMAKINHVRDPDFISRITDRNKMHISDEGWTKTYHDVVMIDNLAPMTLINVVNFSDEPGLKVLKEFLIKIIFFNSKFGFIGSATLSIFGPPQHLCMILEKLNSVIFRDVKIYKVLKNLFMPY